MKRSILMFLTVLTSGLLSAFSVSVVHLKHNNFKSIAIPEPSDIAIDNDIAYIVSDNGYLFETDLQGHVLRRAVFTGQDFEGVEVYGDHIYVVDERIRQIHQFDKKELKHLGSWYVPYAGGRNKGYESIAFNESKQQFIVITEKDPIIIKELNEEFISIKEYRFTQAADISSARWHKGFLYLLSDEDRKILKCDPVTYDVIAEFSISVLNPEGLAFDAEDNMYITADDLERLYFFDNTLIQY